MRKILFIILMSCLSVQSIACDCAGASGGAAVGVLPHGTNHYFGIRYNHSMFSSLTNYSNLLQESVFFKDAYRSVDLLGKWRVSDRFSLIGILPYMTNRLLVDDVVATESGWADPTVLMSFMAINTAEDDKRGRRESLTFSLGVEAPMAARNPVGSNVSPNYQRGSESWDFLGRASYTVRNEFIGATTDYTYKLNTSNSSGYQFGNQSLFNISFFYLKKWGDVSFMPYLGANYEFSGLHKENDIFRINSGGDVWLGSIGTQVFVDNLSFNFQYLKPIVQDLNSDMITTRTAGNRWTMGVLFTFE